MWHTYHGRVRLDLAKRSLDLYQLNIVGRWRRLQEQLAQRTEGCKAHVHHRYALETREQLIKRRCLGGRQHEGRCDQYHSKEQDQARKWIQKCIVERLCHHNRTNQDRHMACVCWTARTSIQALLPSI